MRIDRLTVTVKEAMQPEHSKSKLAKPPSKSQIVPDQNFITQNTADLKLMLESIPEEALNYDMDIFEKDLKEVLNSAEGQEDP